jgi:hypothetical protein
MISSIGLSMIRVLERSGFTYFQLCLAEIGRFGGIGSGLDAAPFDKVSPAFVVIGRILGFLEVKQTRLGVLFSPDNYNHSVGPVGADVMPDDGVGCVEFVACQRESNHRLPERKPGSEAKCDLSFKFHDDGISIPEAGITGA